MIFLEQLEPNLRIIRNKRAKLIGKIDQLDKDHKTTASSNQTGMHNEIRGLEKTRDETIRQLERERDEKVKSIQTIQAGYQKKKDEYASHIKKKYVISYVPKARPLDVSEVNRLIALLPSNSFLAEGYYRKLYSAYMDAISYSGELIWKRKVNARDKIEKTRKDAENQIAKARQKYAAADTQSNQAFSKRKKELIAELGNYDNSEVIRQYYKILDDYHARIQTMQEDWNTCRIPEKRPLQIYIGNVCKRCPTQPDVKKVSGDFGVDTWVRRDNEEYRELPFYIDLSRSCIIILSSASSFSATNSPDKDAVQKILCRMLKGIPPRSTAWSVLDPIHKGGGLGRLFEVANADSLELNFKLFSDRNSCAQEQTRLQRLPAQIVKEMAGRYENLYEYNKANPNSIYPFTWYVDFGFSGKSSELDPVRDLFSTAQTGGTSFLFSTTPQGVEELKKLAKECCRTVPVVHIDCDRGVMTLNGVIRETFRIPKNPDNDQMQVFAAAVKKRFTSDSKTDGAFLTTMIRHKRLALRPFSTTLSLPYAIDGHKRLIELQLDNKEDSHAFICGKAGSGKSTLLHTLILSACIQYGQESLEVWLADGKLDEFRHYGTHKFPQITLVGASKEPEFLYSMVERLEAELQRRSELFAQYPLVNSLDEYHTHAKEKGYIHIPVLLVVIDEFHAMSQSLAKNSEYKQKLENIFRQARSKGIRIVLADHTYEGLRGLSDEAKDQIGNRIAMQNDDMAKMRHTLNVSNDLYTDAMIKTMETLSAGEMIVRRRIKNAQGQKAETQLDKYRGLYTTLEDVKRLSSELKKTPRWKPLLYMDGATVSCTQWDKQDMLDLDMLEPVPEYGVRFYLGRGYTMKPCFAVDLKQEKQQNLSVVGGSSLQYWEVIRAVLLSCRRNGYTPLVFLPQGSDFKAGVKHLRNLCQQIPKAKLLETYGQWCEELSKLDQRMSTLDDRERTVCIFINLELAAEDFRAMPERTEGGNGATYGDASILGRLSMYSGVSAEAAPKMQTFNAMPIIKQILKSGYRSNIYSVVQIGTVSDFEDLFRDRRVFRHRIAINIETESVTSYVGGVENKESFTKHTMYFGGNIACKLMPYKSPEVW